MLAQNIGQDELWKAALETFFKDFLELFFEDCVDLIDFEKPFEFLDKELSRIIPKSESKNRRVDKLVKVFFKDGTDQWFLIHIEIQGQHEKNFAERMFHYFYRIKDKYNRQVTAFALFTYPRQSYPRAYEYEFMGTKLRYEYRSFSILELAKKERSPKNIFGYLIEIACAEKLSKNEKILQKDLLDIIRRLDKNDISIANFKFLLHFVEGYIKWQKGNFFSIFEKEIDLIIKPSKSMGLQELFELKATEYYEEKLATIQQKLELSEEEKLRIVKEAEAIRLEAKRREAELKKEAKRKEAELKKEAEEAKRKEAELKQEAERKEAELKQEVELQNKIIITNLYAQNMDIDLICKVLQKEKAYVQRIIDAIKE